MDFTLIATVLGSQAAVELIKGFYNKKKSDSDATSTVVKTILEWQEKLTQRISTLESELKHNNEKIAELERENAVLQAEVTNLRTKVGI